MKACRRRWTTAANWRGASVFKGRRSAGASSARTASGAGSLDFDLPEAQFIVNRSTGEVEGISGASGCSRTG
ncbi:MAG: hypothetical protein ACLUPV_03755 [Bilophila wadsworthia]